MRVLSYGSVVLLFTDISRPFFATQRAGSHGMAPGDLPSTGALGSLEQSSIAKVL